MFSLGFSQKITRAKKIYASKGITGLSFKAGQFLKRTFLDITSEEILLKNLNGYIIGSEKLKDHPSCKRSWKLQQGRHPSPGRQMDLIPLKDRKKLSYQLIPLYYFNDPFVAELQQIHIIGPQPIPITSDGFVITDTICFNNKLFNKSLEKRVGRRINRAMRQSPTKTLRALQDNPSFPDSSRVTTACPIWFPSGNYFHWMVEHLCKIRGVKRYEQENNEEVTLILSSDTPSFVYEALDLMGYEDQYIHWTGEPLLVERLIVPSFPEPDLKMLEWLRSQLENNSAQSVTKANWIYISRQNAKNGRRLQNHHEFISKLKKSLDIESICLEDISLQEEIATLQHVDGIIGPHGAGLSSMIWTDDLQVVEIFNEVVNAPYYTLAEILDHDYTAISGKGVGENMNKDLNIKIDAPEVLKEVKTPSSNMNQTGSVEIN